MYVHTYSVSPHTHAHPTHPLPHPSIAHDSSIGSLLRSVRLPGRLSHAPCKTLFFLGGLLYLERSLPPGYRTVWHCNPLEQPPLTNHPPKYRLNPHSPPDKPTAITHSHPRRRTHYFAGNTLHPYRSRCRARDKGTCRGRPLAGQHLTQWGYQKKITCRHAMIDSCHSLCSDSPTGSLSVLSLLVFW